MGRKIDHRPTLGKYKGFGMKWRPQESGEISQGNIPKVGAADGVNGEDGYWAEERGGGEGGGGGRTHLLLALVILPLTTHLFRAGAPFLLLLETPPTFGRSLRD